MQDMIKDLGTIDTLDIVERSMKDLDKVERSLKADDGENWMTIQSR